MVKVLFGMDGTPLPGHGGGAVTGFCLLTGLIGLGHRLSVFFIERPGFDADDRARAFRSLADLGVERISSARTPGSAAGRAVRLLKRLDHRSEIFRPRSSLGPEALRATEESEADVCFFYGFGAVEAFLPVTAVPKIAALGDLPGEADALRRRYAGYFGDKPGIANRAYRNLWRRLNRRNIRELLESLDSAAFFAAHNRERCARLTRNSGPLYMPTPAIDEGRNLQDIGRACDPPVNAPYRVALVGHLRGTATTVGLHYFTDRILPALAEISSLRNFEFDVIGKFDPDPKLAAKWKDLPVRRLGFVEEFARTINAADAFLVPIPDVIGNRVRIASAFSACCCVVTHGASRAGMPELVHGENCLIGNDPEELARLLVEACADKPLNTRLRRAGRGTYDTEYRPDVVAKRFERLLVDAGPARLHPGAAGRSEARAQPRGAR